MRNKLEKSVIGTIHNRKVSIESAKEQSKDGCTYHVNVEFKEVVDINDDSIVGITAEYHVSNWYSEGSTVKSFTNGRENY